MSTRLTEILDALDARTTAMAAECTRCGRCVEACPMPAAAGIDASDPARLMGGVLELLGGGAGEPDARRWAGACSGSGHCIEACPEGLNPRFLLAMARRAQHARTAREQRRAAGRGLFRNMSRGVKVLSRLQLEPALLERLSPSSHPQQREAPEVVFYTGCNLLKTPHIGLLCLDVLDRLGVRYEVHGGPASCCGILQARGGDDENAMRQGARTLERFGASGAPQVLSWCPTCQIQFQETSIPVQVGPSVPSFDLTMFPVWLAGRLEELRPHLSRRVPKRVAVHGHPGAAGVTAAVTALLGAVPGVEVVDLGLPAIGYTLNSLAAVPEHRNALLARELAAAQAAGVTTLAGIYHSDHRELVAHDGRWPFEIVNFMEILGESMGFAREDGFKRLKTMGDADAILAAVADTAASRGLDLEEVREVVLADLLGERMLPPDRAEHARYLREAGGEP